MKEMDDRVGRGATLLDDKNPGWYRKVDRTRLSMGSYLECILGQLYGTFLTGVGELGLGSPSDYGFGDDEGPWIAAIESRLRDDEEARGRVALGVALLEGLRPGWRGEIDVERLAGSGVDNISSPSHCILAQIYGDFSVGLNACGLFGQSFEPYGFALARDIEFWIEEIRKGQGGSEPFDDIDPTPYDDRLDVAAPSIATSPANPAPRPGLLRRILGRLGF